MVALLLFLRAAAAADATDATDAIVQWRIPMETPKNVRLIRINIRLQVNRIHSEHSIYTHTLSHLNRECSFFHLKNSKENML